MAGKLDDSAARAAAARAIVEATGGPLVPKDPLSPWERDNFFAFDSVQLRLPLRNRAEAAAHIGMVLESLRGLQTELQRRSGDERAALLLAQSVVRALNRKLNAYRAPRKS